MKQSGRDFHLGDILSVTTRLMISPNGSRGTSELLEFLLGKKLESFKGVYAVCEPWLLACYPELDSRDMRQAVITLKATLGSHPTPKLRQAIVDRWLATQVRIYGSTYHVHPVPESRKAEIPALVR